MFSIKFVLCAICALVVVVRGDLEEITSKVFFDVQIGTQDAGRIVIGLFGSTVPKVQQQYPRFAWQEKFYLIVLFFLFLFVFAYLDRRELPCFVHR